MEQRDGRAQEARVPLADLPFGWFDYPPGANRLIGLVWLSEILYPDLFRHDLRKEVATFYKLFYHRDPTPQQLDALLGEAGVAPR